MADPAADPLADLVKRASGHLTRKLSTLVVHILSKKHAGSFGAAAGFALAVVFAWRFLRIPARSARRKRMGAAGSSSMGRSGSSVASSSEIYRQLISLRESEDRVRSTAQLTPGQIVKWKLNGGRKITCRLLGIILQERSSEELQKHATVRLPVVDILHQLTKFCDLYLMETVDDDESEQRVLEALEGSGLFRAGVLVREKVLFCSTENGRASFVRQLEPDWHIDTSADIVYNLARFIRYQLHISATRSGIPASNVFTSKSLEHFFSHL